MDRVQKIELCERMKTYCAVGLTNLSTSKLIELKVALMDMEHELDKILGCTNRTPCFEDE